MKTTTTIFFLFTLLFSGSALAGHCRLLVNVPDLVTCNYEQNKAATTALAEEIEEELGISARPIVGKCGISGGLMTSAVVAVDVSVYSQEDYDQLRSLYDATPWVQHTTCDF